MLEIQLFSVELSGIMPDGRRAGRAALAVLLLVCLSVACHTAAAQGNPYAMIGPVPRVEYAMPFERMPRLANADTASDTAAMLIDGYGGKIYFVDASDSILGTAELPEDAVLMWLSVDPMLDKYPGISPYAYCLWNPIRLVDPDGRDVWVPDVNGNLIAENKDNSNTLAEYFNTTPQIAASMLREQGYIPDKNGVVFLKEGDVFEIDHGNIPHSRHTDLGIVGNAIRGLAGSGISQDMFSNYWNGDGDIVLTGSQFAGILSFVKANEHRVSNATNGTCLVNFYGNCSFERAYGRATLIKNNAGQIVGFQDTYNFDGKWGPRSLKNEIITRSVNFVSKLFGNVKNYDIRYP